jgi:Uma2 family endonuclease
VIRNPGSGSAAPIPVAAHTFWHGGEHDREKGTMGVMTVPDIWWDQERMLTVEDMEDMPDDKFRYELDDGVLIAAPLPSTLHQLAVARLIVMLSAACPTELVVLLGVGVNISKFQHRVPDLAVVRADSLDTVFQEAPPELVVEVASPRARLYDRNRKKDVYRGFGIPVYWIAEPDRNRPELTVFELRSDVYEQTAHVSGDEEYRADIPFDVTIVPFALVRIG